MMKNVLAVFIILVAAGCGKVADTVVFGSIRTAEEDNPVVEAIAVKDGKHRNCLVHLRNVRREDYKRLADNNIACVASLTWHVGASPEEEAVLA